jgi:6-phosphogluconolactonase
MELSIAKNMDELAQRSADWIADRIQSVLKNKDRFTWVLSGGSTPKGIYRLLASGQYKIDWGKLHFFWGDERYVPFTDERNNAKMAFENLLNHIPVQKEQVHMMRTDIEPAASAIEYEKLLHHYFPHTGHSFDLVLLGLGSNAHTLSLFPGTDLIQENTKWVSSFYLKEEGIYRITLTAPIVNAADAVLFLVSGGDKSIALHHVLEDEYDPNQYPAQLIRPFNDQLFWITDEAAAAGLE